jgi:uracil-DNA glycosylase family protein
MAFPELEALREQAAGCRACGLSDRRTNVVFGEGDPRSPLVLVGEGPGDQEDKTGRPFVGRAGQMLDRALADAGLSRDVVYICNTVKCRACDWREGKPHNRPPTDLETLQCRQWLVPQLGLIAPEVILCIGAPSAKNLIQRNFAITKQRGQYFPCDFARTAIATLHPAYILRQQSGANDGGYSLLVQDIQRAWEAALRLRDQRALKKHLQAPLAFETEV